MDYEMISVDDHIDLQYVPRDVWTERLPASLVERGPRVVELDDGMSAWVCDGDNLGPWAGGRRSTEKRSYQSALERAGLDEEGVLRPTDPELRLADMRRDGIEATVMYGPAVALEIADPELRLAVYRAYNDWLVELCSYDPKRLIGVAMLPAEDAEGATAELRRVAERGATKQVTMHIGRVASPIYEEDWRPFWDTIDQTGVIASFHLVLTMAQLARLNEAPHRIFDTTKEFIGQFLDPLVGLLGRGVLERRPNAKLVLAESGLGWPPWVVQEMDYRYARLVSMADYWEPRGGIGLTMKPSEVFRRQVWVTVQDDQVGLDILHHFGDDKVMWACDYPHPDSTFPESRAVVERLMRDVPPMARRRVLRDNAEAVYGL
ncbi:MAG: amidohydrolase family protein [Acidimicrobiales bacterium]